MYGQSIGANTGTSTEGNWIVCERCQKVGGMIIYLKQQY